MTRMTRVGEIVSGVISIASMVMLFRVYFLCVVIRETYRMSGSVGFSSFISKNWVLEICFTLGLSFAVAGFVSLLRKTGHRMSLSVILSGAAIAVAAIMWVSFFIPLAI